MSDKNARATQYAGAIVAAMLERWQAALMQAAELLAQNNKADVAASVAPDMPVEIVNALKLMQERGDLDLIPDVAEELAQTIGGHRKPVKAEIVSAAELDAKEQEQLRKSLTEAHGEGLVFTFRVDPALLGGLRVRVGDHLIDTSIASRLTSLRESLTAVVR